MLNTAEENQEGHYQTVEDLRREIRLQNEAYTTPPGSPSSNPESCNYRNSLYAPAPIPDHDGVLHTLHHQLEHLFCTERWSEDIAKMHVFSLTLENCVLLPLGQVNCLQLLHYQMASFTSLVMLMLINQACSFKKIYITRIIIVTFRTGKSSQNAAGQHQQHHDDTEERKETQNIENTLYDDVATPRQYNNSPVSSIYDDIA